MSVRPSVSQPGVIALQSRNPDWQTEPQLLAAQKAMLLAGTGQMVPHVPQLFGSVLTSAHADPHLVVPPVQTS